MLGNNDYTPQPRPTAAYRPAAWDAAPPLSATDRIIGSITIACILAMCAFGAVLFYAWFLAPHR